MSKRSTRRVCLVMPSTLASYVSQKLALPPMGLLSLATSLRKSGRDVSVVDGILNGFDYDIPVDKDFYLLGLPPRELAREVLRHDPHVVAFSLLFGTQQKVAMATAEIIRQEAPDVLLLWGGAIPTLQPQNFTKNPLVDALILSEADLAIVALLDMLEREGPDGHLPPGCGVRTSDGFSLNSAYEVPLDLDGLGLPSRDIVDMQAYMDVYKKYSVFPKQFPATTIITSRGCPLRCTFCTSKHINTRRWRALSPEATLAEIDTLVEKYGIREFQLIDENFTANPKRAERIMDLLIERDYGLSWYMMAGTYVMTLNERLIEKMKEAGLYKLKVSFESGSERVLREVIDKPIKLDYGERMMKHAKSVGLPIGSAFIIGFPWETKEEIFESFEFAKRVDFDFTHWALAAPYPKTEMTRRAIDDGLLPENYDDLFEEKISDFAHFELKDATGDELRQWRRDFWQELHFSTPEKKQRFESFQLQNPNFEPIEQPGEGYGFKPMTDLLVEDSPNFSGGGKA